MLLETCWEAIESAGIDPDSIRGQRVGVYIGLGGSEYRDLITASGADDSYLGTSSGMTTGRISYVFGLTGPAMSFDLACASSLVAVHEGIKALQTGEVDLALVGGANAILSQPIMRFHRELGLLSTAGKCLPFDENAEGYVRGEGCGVLLLKRLDEANEDGNPIWSTFLGSAVNQNGTSAGLTVPNGSAQEQLIRDAVARADIDPNDVDYLEAHAMGLAMSDPIEISAASAVYATSNGRERPLLLGSVKSTIGHLEWAAGVAGIVKLILSMAQQKIPAQSHLDQLNEEIRWDELAIEVNRLPIDWPEADRPPIGAVSALGMSGTNAHVIVKGNPNSVWNGGSSTEFPVVRGAKTLVAFEPLDLTSDLEVSQPDSDSFNHETRLLPISGKTPESVVRMANSYHAWLSKVVSQDLTPNQIEEFLADVSWTACVGKSHFECRQAVVFSDYDSLMESLRCICSASTAAPAPNSTDGTSVAFVVSGRTADWLEFGRLLYDREPIVRTVVDVCNDHISTYGTVNIVGEDSIANSATRSTNDESWINLATFAYQIALATYWQNLGVKPKIVIGEGIGKITASCIAGSISLEQGLEMTWDLAKDKELDAESAQRTTPLAESIEPPRITLIDGESLTVVNSPNTVFELIQNCDRRTKNLSVAKLKEVQADCIVEISPTAIADRTIIELSDGNEDTKTIIRSGMDSQVESANGSSDFDLMNGVKAAYEAGLPITLSRLFAGQTRRKVSLPNYPFERKCYWFND